MVALKHYTDITVIDGVQSYQKRKCKLLSSSFLLLLLVEVAVVLLLLLLFYN